MQNPLVRNWRMLSCRGGLALVFGLTIVLRRPPTLGELVILFAAYAFLDGVCALAWALRASTSGLEWWPVALEGAVSVMLGVLAFVWPFISHRMIEAVAGWGVLTGILEILVALRLPANSRAIGCSAWVGWRRFSWPCWFGSSTWRHTGDGQGDQVYALVFADVLRGPQLRHRAQTVDRLAGRA
jgi:uncharacterized membrane protein HdeD (DUF308 family)